MNASDVRKALDEALREAATDRNQDGEDSWWRQDHPWRLPDNRDGNGDTDCAAHKEIQSCCLDPGHGAYGRLLDYLAERVASKLMYRGGAVTNVVATVGEELRPAGSAGPIGNGFYKYEEALHHWPAANLHIRVEMTSHTLQAWVIDSHPKSREELYEKLKVVHGQRAETSYVLVIYDVTSNNAVRAVGEVLMPGTLHE